MLKIQFLFSYLLTSCNEIEHQILLKQEREMNEEQRESFLDAFQTDTEHTLVAFAVLGGVFSEGIDLIGERLIGSIIVGVGLPQINPLTEQRRIYFEEEFAKGYLYAYIYPGFNKVMQAVGRVIRTESDRGIVMMIDVFILDFRRFLKLTMK